MSGYTEAVLSAAGLLAFFVLLILFELWMLGRLGYDVLAHLEASRKKEKSLSFRFEAFGVVAFVLVQPIVFTWIVSRLSRGLTEIVQQTMHFMLRLP